MTVNRTVHNAAVGLKERCPVTGMPVRRQPEWTDIPCGQRLRANWSCIGERILHSRPAGHLGAAEMMDAIALFDGVREQCIPPGQPFVIVQDLSRLKGISFEGRRRFIAHMKKKPLAGLVFYSVQPFFRLSVKLGRFLNAIRFPVHIAADYAAAMPQALDLLGESRPGPAVAVPAGGPTNRQRHVAAPAEWRFESDAFRIRFELIDDHVIHAVAAGYAREAHVAPVEDLRARLMQAARDATDRPVYLVAGMTDLAGASRKARKRYMQSLKQAGAARPIQMYLLYGANRFIQTAVWLAAPFMPFKAQFANDLDDALRLIGIEEDRRTGHDRTEVADRFAPEGPLVPYVQELLAYLGSIEWGVEAPDEAPPVGPAHPFSRVYDALSLIRSELAQLFHEREQALASLNQSEARYRLITESASDYIALCSFDASPKFIYTSPSHRSLGYSDADLVGHTALDFVHPEDRETLALKLAAYLDNTKTVKDMVEGRVAEKIDFRVRDKAGQWRAIEAAANFLATGQVLLVGRDVSEQRRAEEALRQSEEKYRKLAETARDFIICLDLNGRPTYINPAALEASGYRLAEAMQMNIADILPPEKLSLMAELFAKRMAGDDSVWIYEIEFVGRDGRRIPVEVSTTLLREDGRPAGVLLIARDISYRKEAERARRQMEERTRDAQKLESLGGLAGGIAHDFNNLLMGIEGHTSLMRCDLEAGSPLEEHLERIETFVRSAADLTRQLLGFARAGKYDVRSLDINRVVADSCDMFGRTRKEIRIHHRLAADLSTVSADRGQVEQVLLNLYLNAWQAMPDGGEMFVATEDLDLDDARSGVLNLAPGRYVTITVRDTGIGMAEETRRRVFDPFFTTKEMGRGTGLGLASAYGIAKSHGGGIDVDSTPGQGATFRVFLPASDKPAAVTAGPVGGAAVQGTETLLLVDDESMIREVGRKMLERLGYRVFCAASGDEALAVFDRHRGEIDLVILDMIMPVKGGGQTYDELRQRDPTVRVMLSSGYSLDGQASEIMARGCSGFLQKPFDLESLSQKLREVLGGAGS